MLNNNTSNTAALQSTGAVLNLKTVILQIIIGVFLYVNCLMIFTFFKKEAFRMSTRYILFAQMLIVDSILLILSDLGILLNGYVLVPAGPCIILCMLMGILNISTPLTLTAMCLERYIAICMPLRHADISTPRRALACILIIFALGSLPHFIVLFILVASVPVSFYKERTVCSVEIMVRHKWQSYLKSTLHQFYFFVMTITIAFTYLKILATAKAASADNRKSVLRGRRTVILHALQLLLCLIEMWCPFVEAAVFEIDVGLFVNLRYFNFIAFILSPRCLSPLVYGLRDEKFFLALKYYTSFGLNKKISTV